MRILVISDVHANLAALDAALESAMPFGRVWCLGDVVGYGPDPVECIDRLRSLDLLCIAGNHDLAAAGLLSVEDFNQAAGTAALWTGDRLRAADVAWLGSLPATRPAPGFDVTLVHGSPVDPVWAYIHESLAARAGFAALGTRLCFNGHTHVPLVFRASEQGLAPSMERPDIGRPISLAMGRVLINPGSVGQPRDGDPRASFMMLDPDAMTMTLHRVRYDVARTQDAMKEAGLPESLINRLHYGR